MTPDEQAKLAELNAFLGWLEAGRSIVPNRADHAEMLAILESAIAKTKHSIQQIIEESEKIAYRATG